MRPAVEESPSPATADAAAQPPVGYYGKLPARGDFVTQRLNAGFVAAWDEWLRAGIVASQSTLGDGWLDAYLAAPIWRFVLPAAAARGVPMIGVVMPSVDRAGRYFPLTLAAPLQGEPTLALCFTGASWLAELERVALRALEDTAGLDGFEADVAAISTPPATPAPVPEPCDDGGLRLALPAGAGDPMAQLAAHAAGNAYAGQCIFWSLGGARVAPAALLSPTLPAAARFAEFISDGAGRGPIEDLFGPAP
ncbi:MAG: type VI secretion system-associated protein TagF [Alphaproteobacteria bacterium]|nr:type VI secretion system-associated protein TagF [Alphaproteobacteria bacterium]